MAGALLLAGCSGSGLDGEPTAATSVAGVPSRSASAETTTVTPPPADTPLARVEAAPRADEATYHDMSWNSGGPLTYSEDSVSFRTPSGNIGCLWYVQTDMDIDQVVCHLAVRDTPPTPKPADCGPGPGWATDHVVLEPTGATDGICTGGLQVPLAANVLPYGSALVAGDYGCLSEEAGVTCAHTGTGRAFFVSREKFEAY